MSGRSDPTADNVLQSYINGEILEQLHSLGERLTYFEQTRVKKTENALNLREGGSVDV